MAIKKQRELLTSDPSQEWDLTVIKKSTKRSLAANRAYQAWIPAISDEMAMTIPEVTRYIKFTFGLPILLADDYLGPLINAGLNNNGFFQLSYEQQMAEMERLPVTRLFSTQMHKKLRDDLSSYYGAMGLVLDYKGKES